MRGLLTRARVLIRHNWRPAVTLVFVLVSGYLIEEHHSDVPWLVAWQLRCAALLSGLDVVQSNIDRTVIVEIDDATFYRRLGGGVPTSRTFLAEIARIAAGEKSGDP